MLRQCWDIFIRMLPSVLLDIANDLRVLFNLSSSLKWSSGKRYPSVFNVESRTDEVVQLVELSIQYTPFNGRYISAFCPVVLHSVRGKHTLLQHNTSSLFLYIHFSLFSLFPLWFCSRYIFRIRLMFITFCISSKPASYDAVTIKQQNINNKKTYKQGLLRDRYNLPWCGFLTEEALQWIVLILTPTWGWISVKTDEVKD